MQDPPGLELPTGLIKVAAETVPTLLNSPLARVAESNPR